MSVASNSEAVLEGLVDRCNASLQCGEQGGLKSLEAYRDAGAALRELKELLPRGEFGPVAEARCQCCKQWRARLMQLEREWNPAIRETDFMPVVLLPAGSATE